MEHVLFGNIQKLEKLSFIQKKMDGSLFQRKSPLYTDLSRFETYIGLSLLSLFMAWKLYKRFHWSVGLAFAYFSVYNFTRTTYALLFWKGLELPDMIAFEATVTDAQIFMLLIAAFFLLTSCSRVFHQHMEDFFITLGLVDSIVMLGKFFYYHVNDQSDLSKTPYFLLNNSALDSAFISCVLYFVIQQRLWLLAIPFIGACLISNTSTGILGLGLGFFIYYGINAYYTKSWRLLLLFTPIPVLIASVGYWMQKEVLFNSSGRTSIWKMSWEFWRQNFTALFGAGMGTYLVWGPSIQVNNALTHGAKEGTVITSFPTMHNDWFQILFETGVIGLVLAIAVWAFALFKARHKPAIFTSLVVFGATAFIQMNLRWFIFAFFGAWLLSRAFIIEESQYPEEYNSPHHNRD